ncbi:MAG: PGPGW domain-containing protein [Solirubrobacteraceae bacterium]|nr:PGPGW domain-containing protein [Solirubrobacteraceae bacterium]
MATADSPKPRIVQRLEAQRERHRQRGLLVRMLYTIAGFTVLIAGLLMLVLPGPALIVIPIGLAMLSLEFVWAEGLLERALMQGENARRKAQETTTTQRIITGIATALAVAAFVAWALLGDVPLLPF